jgi:cell division protein ZapA
MAHVNVMINGRSYTVACDDGEEEHLSDLARYLDKHVSDLSASIGQVGDSRLLLMAALLVSDELSEMLARVDDLEEEIGDLKAGRTTVTEKAHGAESAASQVLDAAARRIEDIAARLERA